MLRLGEEGLQHTAREHCLSILEMFLEGPGSKVRAVVGEVGGDAWLTALPPLTNMTAQVIFIERTAEILFFAASVASMCCPDFPSLSSCVLPACSHSGTMSLLQLHPDSLVLF